MLGFWGNGTWAYEVFGCEVRKARDALVDILRCHSERTKKKKDYSIKVNPRDYSLLK